MSIKAEYVVYPQDAIPSSETLHLLFEDPIDEEIEGDGKITVTLHQIEDMLARTIADHTQKIMQRGYAEHLDAYDFFHGHFLVNENIVKRKVKIYRPGKGWGTEEVLYADLPKTVDIDEWRDYFLKSDPHFLYHTREHIGPRHPYRGPPRSIIGTADGKIYPLKSESELFISHGSVGAYEKFEFDGEKYPGMGEIKSIVTFPSYPQKTVMDTSQFYILTDDKGRYKLPSGQSFDAYYELYVPGSRIQ